MAQKYLVIGFLLLVTATSTVYYFDFYYIPVVTTSVNHASESVPSVVAYQSNLTEPCAPLASPKIVVEDHTEWRRIDNDSEWHVYSAYIDRRPSTPVARIIAMARKGSSATLFCRWWWRQRHGNGTLPVRAQKQELWIRTWDSPEPDQYYRPFLLSCPLPRSRGTREPFAVSIATHPCGQVSHGLRLVDRSANASTANFAVCLKPLDFNTDVSARLVEWLELQYLLGADTVRAYIRKVHPATRRTLQHYVELERLVAVEHAPPGGSESATSSSSSLWQKRRREMAVYNDCFYAHLHSHRFVVNLDLDEAVVPVASDTWAEMLADAPSTAASLSVRNVYYFDAFGVDEDVASIPPDMHMLRHVVRSSNFTPPGFAQKSFFATDSAQAVTNHFALRAARRDVRLLVGLEIDRARLHHYRRDCPPLMERDCEDNYMRFRERDALLWKYKERLVANFQRTMRELQKSTE